MKIKLLVVLLVALVFGDAISSLASYNYRLGPEDAVIVSVLRHPEFSGEFFIPADGIVDLPVIGQLKVSGMTLTDLSDYITKNLMNRLKQPEVGVTLKIQRQQRVYVLGAVLKSGVYDYKQGWRITECLACAGGPTGDNADCQVTLMSASIGKEQTVNLTDVLVAGSKDNLPVEPGDVVSVKTVKLLPIYVIGQVKTPGMCRVREPGGVLEALAVAGGALDTAALCNVSVTHVSGKSDVIDLSGTIRDGKNELNPKLEPGDLIVVPESKNRIAVLGYVNQPGYFTLKESQKVMLSDAIGLARGTLAKKARVDSIMILRVADGKQERLIFDLSRFLNHGDIASNPELKPGDVVYVPKAKSPDWESLIRVMSSVSLFYNTIY